MTKLDRSRAAGLEAVETEFPEPSWTPEVSVILPVRDEQGSLEELDTELRSSLRASGRSAEIIYVNDGSTDGSGDVLRCLVESAAHSSVRTRVITLRRGFGQTAALAAGIDHAEGGIIVTIDADGQNDPADIPSLLNKLDEGFDAVCGWRRNRNDGFVFRLIPSATANWLIRTLTGVPIHDVGCTLKAIRAAVLREFHLYGDMHRYLPVFLVDSGARVTELPVGHRPRRKGQSKYGMGRVFKVLSDLFFMRFVGKFHTRPMHIFGFAAMMFFLLAAFSAFLMLTLKFKWLSFLGIGYQANFVETPLPIFASALFLGGLISLLGGILAEILIRLRYEAADLHPYSIRLVEDSECDED